jgi:ribosomal protein S6--L-glutamate ligase
MSRTDDRVLTWITVQDDFEPKYIAGVGDRLEALYGEAAARHGIDFRFVEAAELVPACAGGPPQLWYRGEDLLTQRQCFIVSTSSWNAQATELLRAIHQTVAASDSVLLNGGIGGSEALEHDKLAILHHAAALDVPIPPTVAVPFGRYARLAVPAVRRAIPIGPYLIKPRDMIMGIGVLKVDTIEQLTAALDICAGADQGFLVQRFLPNSGDLRTYVVDGEIVASQLRRPAPGNYLANISQGGTGTAVESDEVAEMCRRVVSSLDASYLCVDWLMTADGPVLNEWATAVAGYSGLPEPARTNVADAFFGWVARRFESAR